MRLRSYGHAADPLELVLVTSFGRLSPLYVFVLAGGAERISQLSANGEAT